MLGKSNDTLKAQVLDVLLYLCLYGHDRTGGASKLLTGARPHKSEIPIFQYSYLSHLRHVCRLRFRYCWDLSFGWIPFGTYRSYTVDLRVKASILQDLKLSKRRDYYNQF